MVLVLAAPPPPQGSAVFGMFVLSLIACPAAALFTWLHHVAGRVLLVVWALLCAIVYFHSGGSFPLIALSMVIPVAGYWMVRKRVPHSVMSRERAEATASRKAAAPPAADAQPVVTPPAMPDAAVPPAVECEHCGALVPAGFPHCPGCGRTR